MVVKRSTGAGPEEWADLAIVTDHLAQRGGGERFALSLRRAHPDAPMYTSVFEPSATYPGLADGPLSQLPAGRVRWLRRHHRLALPLLARQFGQLRIPAAVTLCSSAGWAHGVQAAGAKVVYCHTPAHWLYDADHYFRGRLDARRLALAPMSSRLRRWDRRAMATADVVLTNSEHTAARVRDLYERDAEVLPPPVMLDPDGAAAPVPGIEPGFMLSVSRLTALKHVDRLLDAFASMPDQRLVVVGDGPERRRLEAARPENTRFIGLVGDRQLRWLYANSAGLVLAAHEDFGLCPLEAASFGRPTAAPASAGFLETILPGETGVLFTDLNPAGIVGAVRELQSQPWPPEVLTAHAAGYSEAAFHVRLGRVLDEVKGVR